MDDLLKQAKAKAAATYDAAADHFDDEPLAFWDRIGRRTIDFLGLVTGADVLDVGCGTGASPLPAAQVVGPDGFVTGVDLSARLLERARAKATSASLSNVEFRLADMTSLDYPNTRFDAVVSVFSIRSRYGRSGPRTVAVGTTWRETCYHDVGTAHVCARLRRMVSRREAVSSRSAYCFQSLGTDHYSASR